MPPLTLLELDPDDRLELPKEGHTAGGSTRMRIANASTHSVAFKLKSTAPKNYAIKPSTGSVREGEAVEVQILRRPPESTGEDDAGARPKRPDRFLVQAAVLDTEEKKTLLANTSRGKNVAASKFFWEGVTKEELEERQLEVILIEGAVNGSAGRHVPVSMASQERMETTESKETKEATKKEPSGSQDSDPGVDGKNGHGKSAAKEHGDGKGGGGGGNGKEQSDAKGAGRGKKGADGKSSSGKEGRQNGKDSSAMTDADVDAVIGKMSKPGHASQAPSQAEAGSRGAPPGVGPQSAAEPTADSPGRGEDSSAVPRRAAGSVLKKRTQDKHSDVVLQKHSRPVTFVTFNPNDRELYTCSKDKMVMAWSTPGGEFIRQYEGHRGAVWACSVTHDGVLLLTCGADSMVLLWEVASSRKLTEVQLTGVARYVEWAACGEHSLAGQRHFAACSSNFKDRPAALSVWDAHDIASEPRQLIEIKDLPSAATQVAWADPNCEILCSVHPSAEVLFWNRNTGAELGRLVAHEGPTSMVAFNSDRSLMASCGRVDMCVRVWDLSTGLSSGAATCLHTYQGDRPLNAVAMRSALDRSDVSASSTGNWGGDCDCLAGGGQDARDVALVGAGTDDQFDPVPLRLSTDESLEVYLPPVELKAGGHFGPIHALCFSIDGTLCVSGSEDGNVRIRDLMVSSANLSERGALAEAVAVAPAPAPSVQPPVPQQPPPQQPPPPQPKSKAKAKPEPKPQSKAPKVDLVAQIPSQPLGPPFKPASPMGLPPVLSDGLANRVIAVYDFDPHITGWPFGAQQVPLPFSRGQEIEIVKDFGGGWAWGKATHFATGEKQGLFPVNYVLAIAKYHDIMQRTMLMAKAGAPIASPVSKPASPPLKPVSPTTDLGFGLGLSGGAGGNTGGLSGALGSGLTGGYAGAVGAASPGLGPPGLGLGGGLTGAPIASLNGGLPLGLSAGLSLGLAGASSFSFADAPLDLGAAKGEADEEEGDCSQS